MSQTPDQGTPPVPSIDPEPDATNEAGGVDAVEPATEFPPVTPDVPLSAQLEDAIPDEIQEPEGPDSEANIDEPTAEPPG